MQPIRLVLAGMPPMLSDIVRGIVMAESDLHLVEEVGTSEPLLPVVERQSPDVLILGVDPREARRSYDDLLELAPRLKVIDVTTDGRTAYMHELRPHVVELGELSPAELLRAVRSPSFRTRGEAD